MSPRDLEKLLGGFATGTLTDDEQTILFTAALRDQKLFDALADEEALRALLAEPAARAELLAELAAPAPSAPWLRSIFGWLRRPAGLAAAGAAALATLSVVFILRQPAPKPATEAVLMAKRQETPPPAEIPRPSPSGPPIPMEVPAAGGRSTSPPLARQNEPQISQPAAAPVADLVAEAKEQLSDTRAKDRPEADERARGDEALSARQAAAEPPAPVVAGAFRQESKAAAEAAAAAPSYTLELRRADGSWFRTDPAGAFQRGDRVRFVAEAVAPGYFSVTSGTATIFSSPITPGNPIVTPEFVLAESSGVSRFALEFGRGSAPALMKSRAKSEAAAQSSLLARGQPVRFELTLRYR
jgi:hypothetical protein